MRVRVCRDATEDVHVARRRRARVQLPRLGKRRGRFELDDRARRHVDAPRVRKLVLARAVPAEDENARRAGVEAVRVRAVALARLEVAVREPRAAAPVEPVGGLRVRGSGSGSGSGRGCGIGAGGGGTCTASHTPVAVSYTHTSFDTPLFASRVSAYTCPPTSTTLGALGPVCVSASILA